jgi:hypothetical protein
MSVLLLLLAAVIGTVLGRLILGYWFNHIMVYSVTWTISLTLYALDLIHYYQITRQAWVFIVVAWLQIVLGAIAGRALSPAAGPAEEPDPATERDLAVSTLVLSTIGALAVVGTLLYSARQMGGWLPALTSGVASRYQARLNGEAANDVPYLGALLLAGCAFGGLRAAKRGRIDFAGVVPVLLLVLHGVTIGARAMIGIGVVVYVTSLLLPLTKAREVRSPQRRSSSVTRAITLGLSSAVAIGGFAFISATRGLTVTLPGVDPRLAEMSRYVPVLPSIYAHASGSPVAFSEYLKSDQRPLFFSAYTFAPAWRAFGRISGANTSVPYYEESYFTPVESNVATWLKIIHQDFGPTGIAWFPFVFSAVLTWVTLRARRNHRISTSVLAANLMAVLFFSFLVDLMMHGYWVIGTSVSWLIGLALDYRARTREHPA